MISIEGKVFIPPQIPDMSEGQESYFKSGREKGFYTLDTASPEEILPVEQVLHNLFSEVAEEPPRVSAGPLTEDEEYSIVEYIYRPSETMAMIVYTGPTVDPSLLDSTKSPFDS